MFPKGFNNIVKHYAENNRVPILFSVVRDLCGREDFDENMWFISQNELGEFENFTKDTCPDCGESAQVKNIEKGLVVCTNGHATNKDPLSLKQILLKPQSLIRLFYESLSDQLEIIPFQQHASEFTPFSPCGFEPIGVTEIERSQILFLAAFKKLKLKDAAMLQGLITNTVYDSFILFIESIEVDAKNFLSYNTGGVVQFLNFDTLLSHDADIGKLVSEVKNEINIKIIKLYSYLKNELRSVQQVVTPEMFRSMLEYDDALVNRSFKAATSGKKDEFEDIVANLLGTLLPVTQLGHKTRAQGGGKKIESPDGILQVPKLKQKELELMFYDCKSVGTSSSEKQIKKISQPDEDQFARYCKLFTSEKMTAKLTGGILIANDFSGQNLVNKSLQIRAKEEVPSGVKIIYFPLKSLVKLYTRLTTERTKFMLHFESDAVIKLFGNNLNAQEEEKIKSDTNFEIFDTIRKSNANSVYVVENLVDVFFDYVYSLPTRESQYMPFIIDLAEKYSLQY